MRCVGKTSIYYYSDLHPFLVRLQHLSLKSEHWIASKSTKQISLWNRITNTRFDAPAHFIAPCEGIEFGVDIVEETQIDIEFTASDSLFWSTGLIRRKSVVSTIPFIPCLFPEKFFSANPFFSFPVLYFVPSRVIFAFIPLNYLEHIYVVLVLLNQSVSNYLKCVMSSLPRPRSVAVDFSSSVSGGWNGVWLSTGRVSTLFRCYFLVVIMPLALVPFIYCTPYIYLIK